LNAKQVQKATLFAQEAGLSAKATFEQKDYLHTGYPSGSFDVIWAIESVCYADDKSLFLKEAFRLLKKGGRLVMADFFKTKDLYGYPAQMVKQFANSWAINDFAVWEEFEQQAFSAGFHSVESEDAGEAIMPSAKRLYRAYFLGKPAAILYRLFNGKPTNLAINNVESAYLQYVTLKKGWWKYRIVSAEKT
jgi:SAM-dependent methyltransferase